MWRKYKAIQIKKQKKIFCLIKEQLDKKTKTSRDLFLNKKNLKIKMEKNEKPTQNLNDIGANKELIVKNYEDE
jgi:hypothetical protein